MFFKYSINIYIIFEEICLQDKIYIHVYLYPLEDPLVVIYIPNLLRINMYIIIHILTV